VTSTPLRVLLLEDDANDAELLLQELRRVGFAPDWRRVDTEEGFLAELDPAPDIILADYRQPQFNASRALEHLRKRGLDIPVIVVTGMFEEVALACIQQGATDYLLKDRLGRLGAAVTHALEQRRLRAAQRQAEAILQASEQRFRALVEHGSDAIMVINEVGVLTYAAPSIGRVLGYGAAELTGRRLFDLVHTDEREELAAMLRHLASVPGDSRAVHCRVRHKDGSWRSLEVVTTNLIAEASVRGIVINARDVSERQQAEALLRDSEERLRSLVQNVSDVITVLEADGTIRYVTPSVEQLLNYSPGELLDTNGWAIVHPDDVGRVREGIGRAPGSWSAAERIEFRVQHRDGSTRYVEASAANLLEDPSVRGVILTSRDITERKRFEEQLSRQAFSDPLTGLPNRRLLVDRLSRALAGERRSGCQVGVILLDLDRFKVINDTLGHSAGDELLVAVGERLSHVLRDQDTIARFGGDEFVILLDDIGDRARALETAQRISSVFERPFVVATRETSATASIGIALGRAGSSTPEAMLRNADVAMYRAKAAGRAQVVIYDGRMSAQALERLELEEELRWAVERGELRLHYQPEVDLGTGRIVGMEALVRWQHPREGLLQPSVFIPLAEETGHILAIGRWVLEEACRQGRLLQEFAAAGAPLTMSVNLSVREFQRPGIIEQVTEALQGTGLRPEALKLEITESTMMSASQATSRTLRALKGLGVRLAIDDFGTGYSSLSYLRRFPVDTLKIDQSFVAGLKRKGEDRAIVEAVSGLAGALGMDVTAEGIETDGQRRLLEELHCSRGQGYFFSQPLCGEQMYALLRAKPSLLGSDVARRHP
jgi:diguanylate cyclase (GGDEF)-like protein/PAS domain S-box-containing protein